MAVETDVRYQGQLRFQATRKKTGQTVLTDVTADHGGRDEHFTPVGLVAAALGACIGTMVAVVAERSGLDVSTMQVHTSMEMAAPPARRIGTIKATVHIPSAAEASPAVRQKLEAAAHTCPVKNSLHPDLGVEIKFVYG
jgi:putative redox protein